MSLRVYGVVPAGIPLPRREWRLVTAGGLAAVVEDGRARAVNTRNLLAYDSAIRMIADRAAAMLPARFNTVVADDDEVVAALRERRRRLAPALRHVRGRVQMTIRIPRRRVPSGPSAVRGDARPSGTEYLLARRLPELDPLRRAAKRWIREERIERHGNIASVYHLVPRTSVGAYRAAVVAAADAAGVAVVVTGPFPPYAFAEGW